MATKLALAAIGMLLLIPVLIAAAVQGAISAVRGSGASDCTTVNSTTAGMSGYRPDQTANAATIVAVGKQLNVPVQGWVAAIAAALQESGLENLDHGDRDSLGLFQQRPSQGWGTPAQIMNPTYAASQFYRQLLTIPRWQQMSVNDAVQAVERSGFPNAYAPHEQAARNIIGALADSKLVAVRWLSDHGAMTMHQGYVVEDYARRLAGALGVPDFVYEPVTIRRGDGVREVSDGLLVVGGDGVIVQVKSRELKAGRGDSPAKAESWLRKKALEAQRQASGTRRMLLARNTRVRSLRGFERTMANATDWPSVVILDHPIIPPVTLKATTDALYISLTDWLDLHRMVRSTAGVISYVRRALACGLYVPLGREADRYRALAQADLEAGGSLTSFPTLPPTTLSEQELWHAALFDDLVERVADPDGATGWYPETYLHVVEQLDRVPLLGRVRIGAKMEQAFQTMQAAQTRRSFLAFDPLGNRFAFLYDYDNGDTYGGGGDQFLAHVATYGFLRQRHALEAGLDRETATLAIGVLHHPERGRRYVFARTAGEPPDLPVTLRHDLEQEFGIFSGSAIKATDPSSI